MDHSRCIRFFTKPATDPAQLQRMWALLQHDLPVTSSLHNVAFAAEPDFERDVAPLLVQHFHDLHAAILHLMGMDHTRLTYFHQGRDERLTDVYGNVVNDILT